MSISIDSARTSNDSVAAEMLAAVQSSIATSGRRARIESSSTTADPVERGHPTMAQAKARPIGEKLWSAKPIVGDPENKSVLPPRPLLELAEEGYKKLGEMIDRMSTDSY